MSSGVTAADLAASAKLGRVGTRPPLFRYFSDAVKRIGFALTMAKYTMQASTAKSRFGIALLVIVPALQITVYGLIFGLILGAAKPDHFLPFLITGIVLFQFIAGSFSDGAKSIVSNSSLVRSLNFPRVLLPFSSVVSNVYKGAPLIGLMLIADALLGEPITWMWLLIIPIFALMMIFGFGLALIAARLTVSFDEVNQFIPFITRVAFYSSGVFFSIEKLAGDNKLIIALFDANPLYLFLKLARGSIVDGYSWVGTDWLVASAWAFGTVIIGFIFFWLAEERYGRNV